MGIAVVIAVICVVFFLGPVQKMTGIGIRPTATATMTATPVPAKDQFSVLVDGRYISRRDNSNTVDFGKLLGGIVKETKEETIKDPYFKNIVLGMSKTIIYKGMKLYVTKGLDYNMWAIEKIEVNEPGILLPTGVGVGDSLEKIKKIYRTAESKSENYLNRVRDVKKGRGEGKYTFWRETELAEEYIIFYYKKFVITTFETYLLGQ